ncbi:MAG: hypothetical protein FWF29_01950 [Treponema sp.]|nr:hypothetical protein [Treponema sp.]
MKANKLPILAVSASLLIFVFSCATSGRQSIGDGEGLSLTPVVETTLLPRQVGEFLKIIPLGKEYSGICDGFGMSGAQGRNQWHSNDPKTMFLGPRQDFVFDIGFHIEQLGELHIWNYNESGNTKNGIRNVTISVSEDNATYTAIGTFELKKAGGEEKLLATNLTNGSFVDFAGKSARFIKLSPIDNWGGEEFGLSEIRLFRYKQDVYKGAYISASPLERYINKSFISPAESYNLNNGAGLSDPFAADAVHDNNPAHMYAVRDPKTAGFPIDLKGKYPVEKIVIWNYNGAGNTDWGLRTIRISYSEDGTNWIITPETYNLPRASGENDLPPSLVIIKPFYARYLRIDNIRNYGGSRAGLSAVRCYIGEGWFADPAPDWTALFSNWSGWSGADGFFSVNLGGRDFPSDGDMANQNIFFNFSDTMISRVNSFTDFRRGVYMSNNTSAVLLGGFPDSTKITFTYPPRGGSGAVIVPNPPEKVSYEGGAYKWYWLGAPFVVGDKLYITAPKFDQTSEGLWGFKAEGCDLARYDIVDGTVDYSSIHIIKDNSNRLFNKTAAMSWMLCAGVFVNTEQAGALHPDGYVYLYGYTDFINFKNRSVFVGRAKASQIEDLYSYEYLMKDGTWGKKVTNNVRLLSPYGATELSVHEIKTGPDKGKFIYVSMPGTMGDTIQISISSSLTEQFSNPQIIYQTDITQSFPYAPSFASNAKAHTAISNERELFIAYNVNGDDNFNYGDIYRPRYIRFARVPVL